MQNSRTLFYWLNLDLGYGINTVLVSVGLKCEDTGLMPDPELFWSVQRRALKENLSFFKRKMYPHRVFTCSKIFVLFPICWSLEPTRTIITTIYRVLAVSQTDVMFWGSQPTQDWHIAVGCFSVHVGCWEAFFASTHQMALAFPIVTTSSVFRHCWIYPVWVGAQLPLVRTTVPGTRCALSSSFLTIPCKADVLVPIS